jgi:hypothetical protein
MDKYVEVGPCIFQYRWKTEDLMDRYEAIGPWIFQYRQKTEELMANM